MMFQTVFNYLIIVALFLIVLGQRKVLKKIDDVEETVDSHWAATQKEANIIWGILDPKEYDEDGNEIEGETQ